MKRFRHFFHHFRTDEAGAGNDVIVIGGGADDRRPRPVPRQRDGLFDEIVDAEADDPRDPAFFSGGQ